MDARTLAGEVQRLQDEVWANIGPWATELVMEANAMASQRSLEEHRVLQTMVALQRHHFALRARLCRQEDIRKPAALLLKTFRVAKDIERLQLVDLLRKEAEIGDTALPAPSTHAAHTVSLCSLQPRKVAPRTGTHSSSMRYIADRLRSANGPPIQVSQPEKRTSLTLSGSSRRLRY